MLRTHSPRHAGGALVLTLVMMVSMVAGAFAAPAGAEEPTPPDTTTGSTTTEGPDGTTEGTEKPSTLAEAVEDASGNPTVVGEVVTWRRGLTGNVTLSGNDTCPAPEGCAYALVSRPKGWAVTVTSSGAMRLGVPSDARGGSYRLYYKLTTNDPAHKSAQGSILVRVTLDSYGAPSGVVFSHPYRKRLRYKIRDRIERTINSVPPGGSIKLASWSFSSRRYVTALYRAKKRGVSVQIVLAKRNKPRNSSIEGLQRRFGTTYSTNGSWVRKCSLSCRGTKGTMHSKLFLFSHAYRTPHVTMMGSANLTDFAVSNQWNQMNTVSNNAAMYTDSLAIFNQMVRDRPATPRYVETPLGPFTNYWYPATSTRASADFLLRALNQVQCTGAVNAAKGGRTIIKIVVYAWYQERGKWLARKVRQLWNEGCKVQIVYAVSSNPVKKILYSPSGRGRIPMRQIMLTNSNGAPIYYVHDKWMTITGHVGRDRSASYSWHGSFNFSDLGLISDENFQRLDGRGYYDRFARDFTRLWKDPHSRAPSPASSIQNVERTAPAEPRLGTGIYRYMEND